MLMLGYLAVDHIIAAFEEYAKVAANSFKLV